jgi:DNA-binding CsgD family transcriptional regulator
MLKEILKDLQRQINKMKVKGVKDLDKANFDDLRNYITLFKQLDVAIYYEKKILKIKSNYEGFLKAEKTMHEWYYKQIKELESEYDRNIGEKIFAIYSEKEKVSKDIPIQVEDLNLLDEENKFKVKARDIVLISLRDSERKVWELYTDGYTVQKIANKLDKHKQSISATIINIKKKISLKENMLKSNEK